LRDRRDRQDRQQQLLQDRDQPVHQGQPR
ncbi:hypothetical protein ME0901_17690, partial [Lactobacillus delbrueckii subsp. bulgaricus]